MNSKAQFDIGELNPMAILLGLIGAIISVVIAGRMYAGTFMKIIIFIVGFVVMTIVCQFIAMQD